MSPEPLSLKLALVSAAILGFRHGFDYDHVAAITDITSIQRHPRDGMRLGLIYALGHSATVAALGAAVILFPVRLPSGFDKIGERLVGLTLILLGLYVLGCLVRGNYNPPSRFRIMFSVFERLRIVVRRFWTGHSHQYHAPALPSDAKSVFVIGIVHGLGAETPTQLLVFLLAANLGGSANGFLGLGAFVAGLLTMNTLMTASATGLFIGSKRTERLRVAATALTAAYSLLVGCVFLLGSGAI